MKTLPARYVLYALIGALVVMAYSAAWRVTQIDFAKLINNLPQGRDIVLEFLTPDVASRDSQIRTIEIAFPIPCGAAEASTTAENGPRLIANPNCAAAKEEFILEGFELAPSSDVAIRWQFPDGRRLTAIRTRTDPQGYFRVEVDAKPLAAAAGGIASLLQVDTATPAGNWRPSQALLEVVDAMMVTIFMALLSIVIATAVAAPISFLAASNITRKGPAGTVIYYLARSLFNITRSYDSLVMATVFGFWLGFGPFAGSLALTVVTIASLGKLFSEAVESIDNGPIEAMQATGANRLQTVVYGVIPQIIPDFVSFIIYHWDINVRISTIIGFVGGGGIGYYLSQRINSFEYSKAGTAIWAIVIVVMAMDFLSAEVRKKLT
jgi:phosphonate transport system permease protein